MYTNDTKSSNQVNLSQSSNHYCTKIEMKHGLYPDAQLQRGNSGGFFFTGNDSI